MQTTTTGTNVMKKTLLYINLLVLLVLSACAPAATPTPAPTPTAPALPEATPMPQPTPTEAVLGAPTPTEPAAVESPSGGLATFVIVPDETTVTYAVDETFLNENNRLNTAIGATSQVTGQLSVDLANPGQIEFSEFTVDISTLTTDSSRRDNAIRGRWLESSRFPIATFKVNELVGFPTDPQEGQTLTFQMAGDLTVRETTKALTWDVNAVKNGDRLTGQMTTFIMMEDWGVPPPNIAGVLIVKDGVTLTIDFTFQQQS